MILVDMGLGGNHDVETSQSKPPRFSLFRSLLYSAILLTIVTSLIVYIIFRSFDRPPSNFPLQSPITIETGTDVRTVTRSLQEARVVRSSTALYFTLVLLHDPSTIKASTYVFSEPLTMLQVAERLTEGDFGNNLIRLTHIEGEPVSTLAVRAAEILSGFSGEEFTTIARPYEGKLFPETYFIPPTYTEQELLDLMLQTFETSVAPLQEQIDASELSLDEILILASIIEREANTVESMGLVSSVLQNRLESDMLLQADASIEYVLDKPLSELTPEDLEIDSPYNTYRYTGLPPTPIGNPGLDAIAAVLEPTPSDYYYYITDAEGVFHFAETYEEHLRNIEQYLR